MFVYSDSPHWKSYAEETIIPKIIQVSHIVNWSHRSQWNEKKYSFEQKIFFHHAALHSYWINKKKRWTGENYNPLAIIFDPWWKPKVLRFYKAFKMAQHGKDKFLKELEIELFSSLKKSPCF